jgi:phage terminase large subunit GpA-like protein
MDAVSDPAVETVVVMKSAQVGWTEIINNVVGFHVHQDPAPILIVQPTVEMAEAWSKDRLSPMLRDTPALRGLVASPKSRDSGNTLLHKTFPGGHLTIAGANSAAGLASRPIRLVLFDEVDRYPPSAGSEGDPITLGTKRTTTFWNRKVLMGSTPTIANTSRIEAAYLASDQRRYWVPCPHCGEMQTLKWECVKWTDDDPDTAAYHCAACGVAWSDAERWHAVSRGEWRAAAEFRGVAGFHLNELVSTWCRLRDTVAAFLAAKGRPEMLKAWRNTSLGEVWQERGDAPDWERLVERREDYRMGVAPAEAVCLTAGVDVQEDRLECDVWAWGAGYTSWLVDHIVIPGSPRDAGVWDALAEVMARDWSGGDREPIRIERACVDTGGRDTTAVYGHIRRLADSRIAAIKGVDAWGRAQPVQGPTFVDAALNGKRHRRGLRLWTVSSSTWKADLYRRLWLTRGDADGYPPGWVHLPTGVDPEWIKQLVSEQLHTVKDKRGFARQEWAKLRERNEALDCAVYARAALWLLGADRYGERFWTRRAAAPALQPVRREDEAEEQRPMPPEAARPVVPAARPAFRPRWSAGTAW